MLRMILVIFFFLFFNFVHSSNGGAEGIGVGEAGMGTGSKAGWEGKPRARVAVMDLSPVGVSSSTALAISDILRTEIFNTGEFVVLERAQINKILEEQKFQLLGLGETELAIQVGQLLSADKVLVGTVSRIGLSFVINARIVDIGKGVLEFADKYVASSEEELIYGCEWFAKKLAAKMQGKKFKEPVPSYKVRKAGLPQGVITGGATVGVGSGEGQRSFLFLHLWSGYGNNGSISLTFYNTFPTLTKDELGLVGTFPDGFHSIAWRGARSTEFVPFGISFGGPTNSFFKICGDFFYTKFRIAKQATKALYDDAHGDTYEINFEFVSEDYFNVDTTYMGMGFVLGNEVAGVITPYFILSGGLTLNRYEAKTIKGYTRGSSFAAPSEEIELGLAYFISFGLQVNFTRVFGIFLEGRYFGNWFSFTRNIKYEDDSYTIGTPMFIGGISFDF